jgi:chromosome condensin MukBEF ATPase and DNA-binding subunit MukB
MPEIDDHVLLLQLERTYDAIEERVRDLDKEVADHVQVQCDCDCMYHAFVDKDDLEDHVQFQRGYNESLSQRVTDLRSDVDNLYARFNVLRSLVEELRARL